ncbi:MAG: CPBP family glutamic-type intramembrane protease [Promethearchaeota archaeon]
MADASEVPDGSASAGGNGASAGNIVAAVLVVTGVYLGIGYAWFFELAFGAGMSGYSLGILKHLWNWAWATVLFMVVPLLLARKWGVDRSEYGMSKGRYKVGLAIAAVGSLVVVLIPLGFASDPTLTSEYPLARPLVEEEPFHWWAIALWEVGYVLVYYIPYETFWRGFATVLLVKRGGVKPVLAVLFTTALTTVIHWNKPTSEILGAVAVGFIYGFLAVKLDSYYYGLVNHAEVGVTGDIASTILLVVR